MTVFRRTSLSSFDLTGDEYGNPADEDELLPLNLTIFGLSIAILQTQKEI